MMNNIKNEVLIVLTEQWNDWEASYAIAVLNAYSDYKVKTIAIIIIIDQIIDIVHLHILYYAYINFYSIISIQLGFTSFNMMVQICPLTAQHVTIKDKS